MSEAPKRSDGGKRSAREIVFDTDEIWINLKIMLNC
jgi:hypothetical protein